MAITKEVIRIDWKHAISECDNALNKICELNTKKRVSIEEMMHIASLSCLVKTMYQNDDVDGYLELLDENKAILKGT